MSAEQDLLASIFASESPYPWEPTSPDGEAYFSHLEAALENDPGVDEAITAGWSQFSQVLETRWASVDASPTERVLAALQSEFQGRMPETVLSTIATTAAALVQSGRPLAEQLVETVKSVLPGWDTGDLAVLARPLAYSLRDGRGEILDLTLRSAPQADWDALSEIEKARLSLAIASVALSRAQEEH